MNLHTVALRFPADANIIVGQSHFIKTVEDLYEAMVNSVPQVKFGIAFNEASGPCLTRMDGNDLELREAAVGICMEIGAGHIFAVVMRNAFPIHVLRAIRQVPEVVNIYCATANPVQVVVAETEQGRGILGVIDGSSPKGVEDEAQAAARHEFLRKIGYKR